MNRRWLALIVVVLAVLLLVPILLLLFQRGQSSTSPAPSISAVASPTASAAADGIAFADATSPEDAAWFAVGSDPGQFPPRLQVGTVADGLTFEVELQADPAANPEAITPRRSVLGVGDGVVVLVDDDGSRSVLRAVVAETGKVHDRLVSNDVIVNGVLAPDGRIAYYVTADRLSGDLTGAWRLHVGDQGPPEAIEALVTAVPEFRLAAVSRFFTRVLLSPDGATLGLFRCVELDCELRTVRTDEGSLVGEVRVPRGGGDPFAITDQVALLRPTVPDGPHRIGEFVDLVSGAISPIPIEPWPFGPQAMVAGPDGPTLALQTAGFSGPPEALGQGAGVPPEVTLIGVNDMQVLAQYAPPLSSMAIVAQDVYAVGVDLPPGWLLIRGSEPGELLMNAYAMNLADGSLELLPAVGELLVQG